MPTSSDTDADALGVQADAVPRRAPRKRVPADERRVDVLAVAAEVVARDGMHAASTASIAKAAGISHAYLFRLFPTKEELLCAVAAENARVIRSRMAAAGEQAKADGGDREAILLAMGVAWRELLSDPTLLRVNLHGISAGGSVPAVGEVMRAGWEAVVEEIERISGAGPDEARDFVAQGTLLLVISGLGAEASPWVERLYDGPLPCAPFESGDSALDRTGSEAARPG